MNKLEFGDLRDLNYKLTQDQEQTDATESKTKYLILKSKVLNYDS